VSDSSIFIVDDDAANRDLLQALMESASLPSQAFGMTCPH
jgi:FixJ family two-component response regulator